MIKKYTLAAIYSTINCTPPAPIMGINILPLISKETYKNKNTILATAIYIITTLAFMPIHIKNGVDSSSYITSYAASIFILFTSISAASYISKDKDFHQYIKSTSKIIILMFIITSLSLLASGGTELLGGWYEHYYTSGITTTRYNGFMYEASHFCLIATPLLLHFISRGFRNKVNIFYTTALLAPIIATYSIGFLATLAATLSIANIGTTRKEKKLRKVIATAAILAITSGALYLGSDSVRTRADNILSGNDSSTKGRTTDSYLLATKIAEQKSFFFGAGPGQIKIIGAPIIIDYYKYSPDLVETVRIPSSAAEMLASYGALGLSIKITALLFLYFKLKTYKYKYSNLLFLFFFIYQFYGSFMLSTIEVFCFSLAFINSRETPSTNKNPYPKNHPLHPHTLARAQ